MKLKITSLLIIFSIFMFGCSKETESSPPSTDSSIENIKDEQSSIDNIRKKLSDASNYGESEPIERTMAESIEHTKSNLPEDVREIETTFNPNNGTTEVIYEANGLNYTATYMHPFKEDGNNVDEYDLEKTLGITLWVK